MKLFTILFLMISFSDCGAFGNPYKKYYKSIPENNEGVILLKKGEKPSIYISKDLTGILNDVGDFKATLGSNGYIPIGYSTFEGGYNPNSKKLTKFAKKIGATVAVLSYDKAGTRSHIEPSNTTTNHSGTIGNSSYSGTSTTQSNKVVTYNRYNHFAVFYAKAITPKKLMGVILRRLNDKDKAINARNTGAVVSGVGDKSPAFYANILKRDIIIKVNEKDVFDEAMALKSIAEAINDDVINITIIRYQQLIEIKVNMNPLK